MADNPGHGDIDMSMHSTSSISIALQKTDFGSPRQITRLMKEKKYFELLQKSLKAMSEIQKLD